jgi:hypothetical protein
MIARDSALTVPQGYGEPVFENQAGWHVLQTFQPPGKSDVWVCDLSHRPKAILFGPAVHEGLFPVTGGAKWSRNAWYARLSQGEGYYYDLFGDPDHAQFPDGAVDMSDGWTLIAVFGPQASCLMNRLVAVNIDSSLNKEPFFLATRVHNAKVHIINTKSSMGYLIACDRSYGQDLYSSCFHAPALHSARPAGVKDFCDWLDLSKWLS